MSRSGVTLRVPGSTAGRGIFRQDRELEPWKGEFPLRNLRLHDAPSGVLLVIFIMVVLFVLFIIFVQKPNQ